MHMYTHIYTYTPINMPNVVDIVFPDLYTFINMNMQICIHICTHTYMQYTCIHTYTCVNIHVCTRTYICTKCSSLVYQIQIYKYVNIYVHIYLYIYTQVYTYIYTYIHRYTRIHELIYTHIYMYAPSVVAWCWHCFFSIYVHFSPKLTNVLERALQPSSSELYNMLKRALQTCSKEPYIFQFSTFLGETHKEPYISFFLCV